MSKVVEYYKVLRITPTAVECDMVFVFIVSVTNYNMIISK